MKECHYTRKSTFLCVMAFCASGLATSARLLISLEIEWFHLKPFDLGGLDSRDRMVSFETIRFTPSPIECLHPLPHGPGLNERMPLHKEINVSMCNGILRIWLGHVAHLLISLNHRIRRLNHLIISSAKQRFIEFISH